jgi:hypothetical protein
MLRLLLFGIMLLSSSNFKLIHGFREQAVKASTVFEGLALSLSLHEHFLVVEDERKSYGFDIGECHSCSYVYLYMLGALQYP